MKYDFFYGGVFSQWYPASFTIDGQTYFNTEQYMMAGKARTFGDEKTLQKILATNSPRDAKSYGRQVANFDVDVWNSVSRDIVYEANYAKFTQNPELKEHLLETTYLVEASPTDQLWGIGLACDDPDRHDVEKWRGTNWLGEVLNKVREDIKAGVKSESFNWENPAHVYEQQPPI